MHDNDATAAATSRRSILLRQCCMSLLLAICGVILALTPEVSLASAGVLIGAGVLGAAFFGTQARLEPSPVRQRP